MAINYADFFGKAGKAFHAMATGNTAVGTTVEDEVEDFVQQFGGTESLELHTVVEGVRSALLGFQSSASGLNSALAQSVRNLLVEVVKADNPQLDGTVETAVDELIRQMTADSESLDASTVSATLTYDAGNTGDGKVVFSAKRGDGLVNEHALAEDVTLIAADADSFTGTGEEAQFDRLAHDWPSGSGVTFTLTAHDSTSGENLVTNGGFEEEDDNAADLPEDWIVETGTLGTTIKLPAVELQTVVISGTPTSGWYTLKFTDSNGDVHATAPLAYNASQSDVQTALRELPELADITVSTSGTSPNFTHTITFTGVKDPDELTSAETFDTGSIAHNTTTASSANVFKGYSALEFDATGAEQTSIMFPVAVETETQYAVNFYATVDVVPAAGVITVDLVDGVGGAVLADSQSVNNTAGFNASSLTTSWQALTALVSGGVVFRTPDTLPNRVYLRIRQSTAVSAGTSVFLDEVVMVAMDELYSGGPSLAAFKGAADWVAGDRVTVAVANDRAGLLNEWMNRVFAMADSDRLLPTDSGGTETQDDSLVG